MQSNINQNHSLNIITNWPFAHGSRKQESKKDSKKCIILFICIKLSTIVVSLSIGVGLLPYKLILLTFIFLISDFCKTS